jgi:hypothetical protein
MADRVPIKRAEEIAKAHSYDQVIIYARRIGEPGQEWVTTYGIDKTHCDAAARIGDAIGRQVVQPLEDLLARAEKAEAELAAAKRDKERLDFLDRCNAALNERYGTNYGWELILNHNVTRLMLGRLVVDLNDAAGGNAKLPSCRAAIDARIKSLAEGRDHG